MITSSRSRKHGPSIQRVIDNIHAIDFDLSDEAVCEKLIDIKSNSPTHLFHKYFLEIALFLQTSEFTPLANLCLLTIQEEYAYIEPLKKDFDDSACTLAEKDGTYYFIHQKRVGNKWMVQVQYWYIDHGITYDPTFHNFKDAINSLPKGLNFISEPDRNGVEDKVLQSEGSFQQYLSEAHPEMQSYSC